eukprot:TRINITY_DN50084_c0_g1_i1.p1 TRINITY_DN50084_c0_g1~~TRINITY_DN50084_c0_g1_i1.p1  ORF type:complete len:290 (-),score=31.62 TRINITY_DN50084_c0_g1_i1:265-1053(-)
MATFAALSTTAAASLVAPTMRRLILVRHGAVDRTRAEPKIKPGGFYGGNVDVPLSDLGEKEALAAAKIIAEEHADEIQAIWASPMRRALFGARAIGTALAAALGEKRGASSQPPIEVQMHDAFREVDRGPIGIGWTDLTAEEIEARDGPGAMEKYSLEMTPGAFKAINGGEGFCDVRNRVLAQRDAVLQALPLGSAGVIVSHMWVTRAMVGEAMGEPNPMKVDIPTASISTVDYPEGFETAALVAGSCEGPTVRLVGRKPEV